MNKKTLIIIISSVLAVVLVATGIILALSGAFKKGDDSSKNDGSSITETSSEVSSSVDSEDTASSKNESSTNPTTSSSSKDDVISGDTVISVGSVSGKVGKKVTVPVSIKGNPGFMAMLLEFNYDPEIVKYKGYTPGDFLTDYQFNDQNGTLRFLTLEDGDVSKNGVLVNLEFEILKEAPKTDIAIKVAEDSIANQKEQLIIAKGSNGTITIK